MKSSQALGKQNELLQCQGTYTQQGGNLLMLLSKIMLKWILMSSLSMSPRLLFPLMCTTEGRNLNAYSAFKRETNGKML